MESTAYYKLVKHSRWSGREVNFPIQLSLLPPEEYQTIYTSIGEVVYWREWSKDTNPTQALAIYYGAETTRSCKGLEPVNVIAQIDYHQLEELKKVGERIWLNGMEEVCIEKLEEDSINNRGVTDGNKYLRAD